jgi:hypothetical protein
MDGGDAGNAGAFSGGFGNGRTMPEMQEHFPAGSKMEERSQ